MRIIILISVVLSLFVKESNSNQSDEWQPDTIRSLGRMLYVTATFPDNIKDVNIKINNLKACNNLLNADNKKCDCQILPKGSDPFDAMIMPDSSSDGAEIDQFLLIFFENRTYEISTIIDSDTAEVIFQIDGEIKKFNHLLTHTADDESFNELIEFTDEFISEDIFAPDSSSK